MLGASFELVQGSSRPYAAAGQGSVELAFKQAMRQAAESAAGNPAAARMRTCACVCAQAAEGTPSCLNEGGLGSGAGQLEDAKGGCLLQQGGSDSGA